MGYRDFRDTNGTAWMAWDVVPHMVERRQGPRRHTPPGASSPAGADRRIGIDRRMVRSTRARLGDGMDGGWLCFESGDQKRRLAPIPPDWLRCGDTQLDSVLRAGVTRARTAPQGAVAARVPRGAATHSCRTGPRSRLHSGPMEPVAYPAESVEGWYALHQMYTVNRALLREVDAHELDTLARDAAETLESLADPDDGGWTRVVPLTGSRADVMLVHFRPTFDALGEAQRTVQRMALADYLDPAYSFLSVAEAGMYHLAAKVVRETREAGGKVGDAAFRERLAALMAKEAETEHVRKRLYPEMPADMPYVCFYPMDKRRDAGQNWYTLPVEERSRLMMEHGMSGRRYAGRVSQVVTGSIGFDAWEWGVTLFARDPLEFKKIVTEMRFDEASAKYGEFGEFFVGKVAEPEDWVAGLL